MKQLVLQFEVVPRFPKRAANDLKFKRFHPFKSGCSTLPEVLIDQVQAEDRLRLLEPVSLPKVLRGRGPFRRPQTAIIALAAQVAYARRIDGGTAERDPEVKQFFQQRARMIDRLALKLRDR